MDHLYELLCIGTCCGMIFAIPIGMLIGKLIVWRTIKSIRKEK